MLLIEQAQDENMQIRFGYELEVCDGEAIEWRWAQYLPVNKNRVFRVLETPKIISFQDCGIQNL